MTLTKKIIKEFDEQTGNLKVSNFHCSKHGYIKPEPICPKCRNHSLHQIATEAIEAVKLERQIISGDFDAGYNSATEDMEEKAKKFLENNL